MRTLLITAAIATSLGFASAWYVQDLRSIEDENHRITQQRAEEQKLHALEQARSAARIAAENAAKQRESRLRLDAAAARAESGRLRDSIGIAVQAARASAADCPERAATLGELLTTVTAERRELAEKADRHVIDIQALMEREAAK